MLHVKRKNNFRHNRDPKLQCHCGSHREKNRYEASSDGVGVISRQVQRIKKEVRRRASPGLLSLAFALGFLCESASELGV